MSESKYSILVVEDDEGIRNAIGLYLRAQGYSVYEARHGLEGLEVLKKETIHLGVVDIMMPKMDGLEFVLELRKEYDFPIIFLSAKSEEIDKITGLTLGADDYVTKPFTSMELVARVKAHLRRYEMMLSLMDGSKKSKTEYQVGDIRMDDYTKQVFAYDHEVRLTPIEYEILKLFIQSPGRVYSMQQIYEHVWEDSYVNNETIMVHIRNLREKIEKNPKEPQYIKVVWGVGYKMEVY